MHGSSPAVGNIITLQNGRQLCYSSFGTRQRRPGRTVLYFHGYLSSRLEASLLENEANQLGLRLLAFDRSGYGGSSADNTRTPENSVGDAQQLLEVLLPPQEKVIVMAASGGSPYAVAFCAAFPNKCQSVCLLVPYALPASDKQQDLTQSGSMHPMSRGRVLNAAKHPWRTKLVLHMVRIMQRIPHGKLILRIGGFPPADMAAIEIFPGHAAKLRLAAREGTRKGISGAYRDLYIMATAFMPKNIDSITCQTVIWAGEQDSVCPQPMALLYERLIPGARGNLHMVAGRGHFLGFQYGKDVLASLL